MFRGGLAGGGVPCTAVLFWRRGSPSSRCCSFDPPQTSARPAACLKAPCWHPAHGVCRSPCGNTHRRMRMCVCPRAGVRVRERESGRECGGVCIHTCVCVCMCVCVRARECVCVCVLARAHTHQSAQGFPCMHVYQAPRTQSMPYQRLWFQIACQLRRTHVHACFHACVRAVAQPKAPPPSTHQTGSAVAIMMAPMRGTKGATRMQIPKVLWGCRARGRAPSYAAAGQMWRAARDGERQAPRRRAAAPNPDHTYATYLQDPAHERRLGSGSAKSSERLLQGVGE